jgi:hypothetical protein
VVIPQPRTAIHLYCPMAQAYDPYVLHCPTGWVQVHVPYEQEWLVYSRTFYTDLNRLICKTSGYRLLGDCQAVRVTFAREGHLDVRAHRGRIPIRQTRMGTRATIVAGAHFVRHC